MNPDDAVRRFVFQPVSNAVFRSTGRSCYWLAAHAAVGFCAGQIIWVAANLVAAADLRDRAFYAVFGGFAFALGLVFVYGIRMEATRLQAALESGRPALAHDGPLRLVCRWWTLLFTAYGLFAMWPASAASIGAMLQISAMAGAMWFITCDPAPPQRRSRLAWGKI